MNHPAVGTHLDLDLLRIFGVATEKQRFSALATDTFLGRQYAVLVLDWQMGVIPSFGAGVVRLLAPFPPRSPGVVLGIVQVIGAITPRRFLGAFPEEVRLEFAFFPLELFDFLLQLSDAAEGLAMETLPIARLLTQFEVLALESREFAAQLVDFLAPLIHQVNRL
jgi:hypothetical protein